MKVSLQLIVSASVLFIWAAVMNALFTFANVKSDLEFYGAILLLLLTVLAVPRLLISVWKW